MNHDAYDNFKRYIKHKHRILINYSDFGIICEAISGNYPGGNWSPNLLVKTPTLNITLNKFAEVIGGS